jgi:2-dehydro-3-deoxygluconokinase
MKFALEKRDMPVSFRSAAIVGVGEAMVEFAPVEGGLFAQGFAGDTLNTCWYLARLAPPSRRVRYLTRVGRDPLSERFVDFLIQSGIDASLVSRDPERVLGLYLITLTGAERRFTYWRESSAARRLADDASELAAGLEGAALIHVSGITLAIIEAAGRRKLFDALEVARAKGAVVSFDPNLRRRLWRDEADMRAAMDECARHADIALPSFDDEADLWGDATPGHSADRLAALGVKEIVVKNGAGEAHLYVEGVSQSVAAQPAKDARDTTGAGDSFNAGYLAARLHGLPPVEACAFGHRLAGEVVRWPGALAPPAAINPIRRELQGIGDAQ